MSDEITKQRLREKLKEKLKNKLEISKISRLNRDSQDTIMEKLEKRADTTRGKKKNELIKKIRAIEKEQEKKEVAMENSSFAVYND